MIHLFLGTKHTDFPGPDIIVNCLWCEKQQVSAHTRKRVEWLTMFRFLPIFPFRTVFVQCDSCHQDMIANCSMEEVARSNPLTLKYHLVKHVSFIAKACIVLGLLLCWAVYIGLVPAIIGYVYGRKYGGSMKKYALWGLILNIFSLPIFVLLAMLIQLIFK